MFPCLVLQKSACTTGSGIRKEAGFETNFGQLNPDS